MTPKYMYRGYALSRFSVKFVFIFYISVRFKFSVVMSATTSSSNKGNNKITELRTILQRESQNS
jgi:hypothetical protein